MVFLSHSRHKTEYWLKNGRLSSLLFPVHHIHFFQVGLTYEDENNTRNTKSVITLFKIFKHLLLLVHILMCLISKSRNVITFQAKQPGRNIERLHPGHVACSLTYQTVAISYRNNWHVHLHIPRHIGSYNFRMFCEELDASMKEWNQVFDSDTPAPTATPLLRQMNARPVSLILPFRLHVGLFTYLFLQISYPKFLTHF
jgi:hypothetical protein